MALAHKMAAGVWPSPKSQPGRCAGERRRGRYVRRPKLKQRHQTPQHLLLDQCPGDSKTRYLAFDAGRLPSFHQRNQLTYT